MRYWPATCAGSSEHQRLGMLQSWSWVPLPRSVRFGDGRAEPLAPQPAPMPTAALARASSQGIQGNSTHFALGKGPSPSETTGGLRGKRPQEPTAPQLHRAKPPGRAAGRAALSTSHLPAAWAAPPWGWGSREPPGALVPLMQSKINPTGSCLWAPGSGQQHAAILPTIHLCRFPLHPSPGPSTPSRLCLGVRRKTLQRGGRGMSLSLPSPAPHLRVGPT